MGVRRGLAAGMATLVVAYVAVPGLADLGGDVINAYSIIASLCAAVLVGAVATWRARPSWPWYAVAAAGVGWVAGDMIYDSLGTDPVLSIADVLYLPGYVAMLVAAGFFLRVRARQRDADSMMEAAMVGLAGLYGVWLLVIEPSLNKPGVPVLERVAVGVYPTLGAIALVLLVKLLITGTRPASAMLLTAALAVMFLSDGVYAAMQQTSSYSATDLPVLDAGWLAAYALFATAALHPSMRELVRGTAATPGYGRGRLFVIGASMLAIPAVYLVALLLGHRPQPLSIIPVVMAMVPLVLWRVFRLQREVERSRTYFRSVALHASDVYLVIDDGGIVADVSGSAETLTGIAPERLLGETVFTLVLESDRALCHVLLADAASRPGATVSGEVRLAVTPGVTPWVSVRCTSLLDDPAVRGIVVNLHDITDRKQAEGELARQALHDPLTGLANRALLRDRIGHALAQRRRSLQDVALLFVDLDGFKVVNDSLGHGAGDLFLELMARRLVAAVRPGDTVARLGGDEFGVLLEGGIDLEDEAVRVGERICQVIADPAEIEGKGVAVKASVGVAVTSRDGQPAPDDLLRDADTAMYGAKAAGGNRVLCFEPGMRQAVLLRVELEAELRDVINRGELVLLYQPLVELRSARLVGFEALVRWPHPRRGLLTPDEFIPLAEQTGLITEIGAWVLERACRTAASWPLPGDGGPALTISINVSGRQLADGGLVAHVAAALSGSGLAPERLTLELTETVLVDQPEAVGQLEGLRALGVRLAIDDFGVGYSSLGYLRSFPVDVLKIDHSFVSMIGEEDHAPALVRGLLELGQTLELQTVAEGIETNEQLQALAEDGCDLGQGFLFARPLDEVAAARLARHGDPVSLLRAPLPG